MIKLFRYLVFLFLLIGFSFHVNATTYYVNSLTGDNTNNGLTSGTAWETVAGGNSTTYVQGDLLYITQYNYYITAIGSTGTGNDQFNTPKGIDIDGTNLYIADIYNDRIIKRLVSDLSYVSKIGSSGTWNDYFQNPGGVYSDGTHIYVTDTDNYRIVKRLASDLSYVSEVGSSGSGNDQFNKPRGITGDGTNLYIIDSNNHRIVKRLAADLTYISKVGSSGSGNDQFSYPREIDYDGTNLYIADSNNDRIVKRLASNLSYVSKIGSVGTGDDQFDYPRGICHEGLYVYVADTENDRIVQRLASDLSYVNEFGTSGSGPGQLDSPKGVDCDGTYLYITDSGNNRLVKWYLAENSSSKYFIAPNLLSQTLASSIITRARYLLNETTAFFWSDAELLVWVNNGIEDISNKTGCIEAIEDVTLVDGQLLYSLSAEYLKVKYAVYKDSNYYKGLNFGSYYNVGHEEDVDEPVSWFMWKDQVGIYPVTDSDSAGKTAKLYFSARPYPVPSDAYIPIPGVYDSILVKYVVAQAFFKDGMMALGQMLMDEYQLFLDRSRVDFVDRPEESMEVNQ